MLITFRRYIILQKHVIQSNPALHVFNNVFYNLYARSVEVIQSWRFRE